MDLLALQNGSDIRGIAMEGIPGAHVNLTFEAVWKIGWSYLTWLSLKTGKPKDHLRVAIGSDPRCSGPGLKNALYSALANAGTTITDTGLSSTPAMFMSTQLPEFLMDGAIMITASHLPYNRNGLKLFTKEGGLDAEDISRILETASHPVKVAQNIPANVRTSNLMEAYGQHVQRIILSEMPASSPAGKPLDGFRIIVDAGNGSGGFFVREVLEPLGADTRGSLFLEPDGHFPNHPPNPEDPSAIAALKKAVIEHDADLGIIFDTDVDRAAFVDAGGMPIFRNHLIALASAIILESHPASWIVTDSVTSNGVTDFIENNLGGYHHRFRRGYRKVINEGIRLNAEGKNCHLAIETSGHAAFKQNYWLDDGAYLTARILAKMMRLKMTQATRLSHLIEGLKMPVESREFRIKIKVDTFKETGPEIISGLEQYTKLMEGWTKAEPNYEGIRVQCGPEQGWFLLRLSLHDPVLPFNMESDIQGGLKKMLDKLHPFFSPLGNLIDIQSLTDYMK